MFGSFTKLVVVSALALAASIQAQAQGQVYCGGQVTSNGTQGTFNVQYFNDITYVTMFGLNTNLNASESYVLYCGDQPPGAAALMVYNIPTSVATFKVPLQTVAVGSTYVSSYIELIGRRNAITVLADPKDVVSPCLQQMYANGSITALNDGDPNQYNALNGSFRENQHTAQKKDIWIPSSNSVDPLLRSEYITAVSLFFNDGQNGELVYSRIKAAYTTLQADMARIPAANKKRIGWVYYDFSFQTWRLRNNDFSKGIITAAGGIPFPLSGDVQDDATISADEIKTLLLNSQFVIDETNFTGQAAVTTIDLWRNLAGFQSAADLPVLMNKFVYSLDNTISVSGTSDANYRLASRPDLLLRDLISVQYPLYGGSYMPKFLNKGFSYGTGPAYTLNATACGTAIYNSGDITNAVPQLSFTGDGIAPPALVGSGIYGSATGGSSGGGGGGNKTGIIVAVVCVAAVLGAGFAFAFFKWGKRAKEDRFIELEEEMNNEIPLH
ncbi:hypothetical protein BC939DRAFT_493636 [Gamsiella multidivaricata]|uniref:uncharacterized protein n=1 Tax=Gamsiella multidivaricata TaxID=101098 RepID=UPI002220CBE2|nr:uncharacterized protein BC939DRAFT_493636 [Gamsiella multidivaricata]KAG0368963.1 hypothetical protein BGZ54_000710 [Gamsiella multidivaricata]KAI7822381.1 hypothetical protein BC939DRAFT_493636 [Gamsiella multidivaricata]